MLTKPLESTCAIHISHIYVMENLGLGGAHAIWTTDMSVGMIDIAYTVDIPRCWCDHAGIIQMITLMQHIKISIHGSYLL